MEKAAGRMETAVAEPLDLMLFLAATLGVATLWAKSLWYLDERSSWLQGVVFFLLSYTRRGAEPVRALLLSGLYYGLGLLSALLLAVIWRLPLAPLMSVDSSHVALVLLGVLAEISLAHLLISAIFVVRPVSPERFGEMQEIPWIVGLRHLSSFLRPLAAATGGVVEEIFFRGVVLAILLGPMAVPAPAAVLLAAALFLFQQLLQVQTPLQRVIVGTGCVVISLVGGLLVVLTGSVVPAVLCHASFVIFFLDRGEQERVPDGYMGRH